MGGLNINKYEALENFVKDNKRYYSESTLNNYPIAILDFFNFCPQNLDEIKRNDILAWINNYYIKGAKVGTIRFKISAIKSLFNYCMEEKIISKNPSMGIDKPKADEELPKYIDRMSIFKLREALKGNVRDRAIFETLYYTGVRVSELVNIKLDDIDFEQNAIWIRKGKGNKERYVFFTIECSERIKEYLKGRNDNNSYLFITRRGTKFTRYSLRALIKRYVKKAGVPKWISVHNIRHTFATELALRGLTLDEIAELLGHKDLNNARRYTKLLSSIKKDV